MREMNVLATGHVSFFERMEGVGKPKDLNEGRMERSGIMSYIRKNEWDKVGVTIGIVLRKVG